MSGTRHFREAALALADAAEDVVETWHGGNLEMAVALLGDQLERFNRVWDRMQNGRNWLPIEPFSRRYESHAFGALFDLRCRLAHKLLACSIESPLTLSAALAAACAQARAARMSPIDDPVVVVLAARLVAVAGVPIVDQAHDQPSA